MLCFCTSLGVGFGVARFSMVIYFIEDKVPAPLKTDGITWREAIARQNAVLGVKISPNPTKSVALSTAIAPPPQIAPVPDLGGRLRHVSGVMNGTEKKYAAHLELRRVCGEITTWKFEAIKLKLAKATFYNPDFLVVMPDHRIELHEVKAWMEDDAAVKLKVVAEMFPEFRFVLVKWNKELKNWTFKTYGLES